MAKSLNNVVTVTPTSIVFKIRIVTELYVLQISKQNVSFILDYNL